MRARAVECRVSFDALRGFMGHRDILGKAAHAQLTRSCVALAIGFATSIATVAEAQAPPAPAVKPPVVVTHVDAVYPPSALVERKHADVVLAVTVDADGHVSKVDVLESGGPDLDEAATVAARQWTFVPAMRDSKPVASRIRVPFHFAPPAPPPELVTPPAPPEPEVPIQPAVPQQVAPSPAASTPPTPAAAPAPGPPSAGPPPEVVDVRGRAAPPSAGASDFNLRVGALADIPRKNASELLKLAPGILLTNEGGEGHAEQVFLRGFDAREGQDIEFTVGGVPINESGNLHGNGYAETHFILPEVVERLRVVEGPFDPRQGNYAVAGSADYELGLEKRGLTAKYTVGSYNTQRGLLTWGPNGESTHTFGAAEVYSTDGFGKNRDAVRGAAMGQYEGQLGQRGSYRVTATGYSTHFHTAGVIREDDYEAGRIGFFDTYDPRQGGDSSRYSISGDLETRVNSAILQQQVFLIRRVMRLRENFTGFLLDVQEPLQTLHMQRGDLIDLDVGETTFGARGYARLRGTLLGLPQQVEFGYFARGDDVTGSQQRIQGNADPGQPYKTDTNLESTLGDLALYAAADLKILPWIALRGGLRSDVFTFNVNNLCAVQDTAHPSTPTNDASCLTEQDFGAHVEPNLQSSTASTAILPRASVIVGPIERFSLSLSYGQGVRSVDPIYITQDIATPFASITSYEGGITYGGTFRDFALVARSIAFQTHVDKDLIFSEVAGRNVLGVGTTRTGWVGAVRATGAWFDESANVTLVRSTFDDTHLLVPYIPDVVVRSDTAVYTSLPVRVAGEALRGALAAGVTYVGPRALPFGQRSGDIFTVDTSATLAWSSYEVGLIVSNLLDNRYRLGEYNFASDFHTQSEPTLVPVRHFTAGAPRSVFGTFAVTFGGV
jgi:iron complex outermembrane recepter protein